MDEVAFRTDLMRKVNRFIYTTAQKNCYDYGFNSEEEYDQELSKFGITDERSKRIAKNLLKIWRVVKPFTFEVEIYDETGPKIIERRIFSFNIFAPAVSTLMKQVWALQESHDLSSDLRPNPQKRLDEYFDQLHVKKDHNS